MRKDSYANLSPLCELVSYILEPLSVKLTVKNHTIKINDLAEVQPLVKIFTCNQIKELHRSTAGFTLEEFCSNKLTLRHRTHVQLHGDTVQHYYACINTLLGGHV